MGLRAKLSGFPLLAGNPVFTGASAEPLVQELSALGLTLFTVTLGGQLLAAYGLADTPRHESSALLADLIGAGKRVMILSGDTQRAVDRFARSVDIPSAFTRATCTPADKAEYIASLQRVGQRVAFVGDGTNDGPALAQADLAIAIGTGSKTAVAASGAIVFGSSLRRSVLGTLSLAKHAQQHIVAALAWCVVYFVFAILLASGAFVKFRVQPQWAGLGELISILPVLMIGAGLDLRWRKQ